MRIGDFSVEVEVKGRILPEYFHASSGRTIVEGTKDCTYSLHIANSSKRKAAAKVWVDGRYKGTWNMIKPGKSKVIRGFSSGYCYREFTFAESGECVSNMVSEKDMKRMDNLGTILVSFFPVKVRDQLPSQSKPKDHKPLKLPKERSGSHMGIVTKPGREIARKQPSYKFSIASSIPIATLKLNYSDRDNLLGLKINSSVQEYKSITEQNNMNRHNNSVASSLLYDDTTSNIPYFTTESNLLETFPTTSNSFSHTGQPFSNGQTGSLMHSGFGNDLFSGQESYATSTDFFSQLQANSLSFDPHLGQQNQYHQQLLMGQRSHTNGRGSSPSHSSLFSNGAYNPSQQSQYSQQQMYNFYSPSSNASMGNSYSPVNNQQSQQYSSTNSSSIVVNVRCPQRDNKELKYRILNDTQFKYLMQEYCAKQNLLPDAAILKYKGVLLPPEKTPTDMNIADGGVLEVSFPALLSYGLGLGMTPPSPQLSSSHHNGTTAGQLHSAQPFSTGMHNGMVPGALQSTMTDDLIYLKVGHSSDPPIKFRMKKTDTMSRLLEGFCKKKGFHAAAMQFVFDGKLVPLSSTPKMLDMENDDLIDAQMKN